MPTIPIRLTATPAPEVIKSLRQTLAKEYGEELHNALQVLLQNKQLYQSERVTVPKFASYFPQIIDPSSKGPNKRMGVAVNIGSKIEYRSLTDEQIEGLGWLWTKVKNAPVVFFIQSKPGQPVCELEEGKDEIRVQLPIVSRHCVTCSRVTPHHSGFLGAEPADHSRCLWPAPTLKGIQVFLLPYQCQQCRDEPLVFMLRRDGAKLQLTGRSMFVMEPTPDFVPSLVRTFYSESLIANSAGKPLAGCLYLRLLTEHHMRTFVQLPPKATGDELADAYAKVLDPEFPRSRSSLRVVYSDLSEVIHAGREDAEVFSRCLAAIHEHFRLLAVIPIPATRDNLSPPAVVERAAKPAKKKRNTEAEVDNTSQC